MGKPSTSNNLAGFLRTSKRRQSITRVSGKSTKDVTTSCQESAHQQELCLSGSGVGTAFSGVGLPLAASLGGLGLICGVVSVITTASVKKVSRKVTKHEKTVSVCESKINCLKDRISKALADDMLSDEEFKNILAEMAKYHEMKKDIRHKFQKDRVKKWADFAELRRQIHAEMLKKLAFEEDHHRK